MKIDRRQFLGAMSLAGAALASGHAEADWTSDWMQTTVVAGRFVTAGIRGRAFREGSSSMVPTLQFGDVMLGDQRHAGEAPKRGDIIAFRGANDTYWLKRVIGLPGERISCSEWQFSVNGDPIPLAFKAMISQEMFGEQVTLQTFEEAPKDAAPYLVSWREKLDLDQLASSDLAEVTVPADQIFVAGDCRSDSMDSRISGMKPVRIADVLARIVFRERPNAGWLVPESSVEGFAAK